MRVGPTEDSSRFNDREAKIKNHPDVKPYGKGH